MKSTASQALHETQRKPDQGILGRCLHSARDFSLIMKAELIRDYVFMKRYPLEPLSFLFFMYLILLAIYFGYTQLASGAASLNREKMIIGYCLMQFVMATQMGWSGQIQYESQTGTLEQLSISGHSLGGVLLARGVAQIPRQIFNFFLLVSGYILTMPGTLINILYFPMAIPMLFILAFGIFGVAYLFAGITLLFKRIGFFFQIINFAFLGLFWQDRQALGDGWAGLVYDFFPLTQGMRIMQGFLTGHDIPVSEIWLFALTSAVSCMAGFALFLTMEKRSRKLGLLSQY